MTQVVHFDSNSEQKALTELVTDIIAWAKANGASAVEVGSSVDNGYSVTVRKGDVETIEYNRDKGVGISVYFGQRKGSASTSDTTPEAIQTAVEKACHIAKYTHEDPCHGLAEQDLLAFDYPNLDLCHPWGLPVEQAIELATKCEQIGLDHSPLIHNSEGGSISTYQGVRVYANSNGFVGAYPVSRHNISCMLLAEKNDQMERDYYYTCARDPNNLESAEAVAKIAAERTVKRLGAKRLATGKAPVIFAADIAGGLFSHFLGAIRGSSIYRESSFLLNHLNKKVFADFINIYEDPHLPRGLGSAPFDDEGVKTQRKDFVTDGVLQSYILSSYSARKLNMQTTGNAGGVHNLFIKPSSGDLTALLKQMDRGLLVTELMGHGVNIVTGDYSRGASGFWVENGEIQYPVHEITIAGNLKDLFLQMVAVGDDVDQRSNIKSGSVLLEEMMIAGE